MLTTIAKEKVASYITSHAVDVRYRINGTWYEADNVNITIEDGLITADFVIDPDTPGIYTIEEIGLFDMQGIQWFSNTEAMVSRPSGGDNPVLYRYTIDLQEM